MYSRGTPHTDEHWQDDQLEPSYESSLSMQNVALKIYLKWWTIEKGEIELYLYKNGFDIK